MRFYSRYEIDRWNIQIFFSLFFLFVISFQTVRNTHITVGVRRSISRFIGT